MRRRGRWSGRMKGGKGRGEKEGVRGREVRGFENSKRGGKEKLIRSIGI